MVKCLYVYVILILLGIIACSETGMKYKRLNYQNVMSLEGKLLNKSFLFSEPAEMVLVDSLIIIHDSQKQDACFHIFNVEGDYLESFGVKGRGPGEIVLPVSMHYSENRKAIVTYDFSLRKMVFYNIQNILKHRKPFYTEVPIASDLNFLHQVLPYKRNFVLRGPDINMRFAIMDSLQHICSCYSSVPQLVPDDKENWAIINYLPQCAISPNGEKMVLATYVGSMFEIFNIKGDKIVRDTVQYYYPPIYNVLQKSKPAMIGTTPETILGCHNVFVSDSAIYAIYEGESAKKNQIHKKLMVFDWNGEFYKQYCFKEGDPVCICVDEKNNTFYCVILNDKFEFQLTKYLCN